MCCWLQVEVEVELEGFVMKRNVVVSCCKNVYQCRTNNNNCNDNNNDNDAESRNNDEDDWRLNSVCGVMSVWMNFEFWI